VNKVIQTGAQLMIVDEELVKVRQVLFQHVIHDYTICDHAGELRVVVER